MSFGGPPSAPVSRLTLFQKEKKNLNDFEGIYVAQDLDVPDAQRIIDLENLKGKFKSASLSPPPHSAYLDPRCLPR